MRTNKQPLFSVHRLPSQEDIANFPIRQNTFDNASGFPSLRDVRSFSKSKKKLRYHLFRNKNLVTENQFYSPNRIETSKGYSSYLTLLPNPLLDPKSSLKPPPEEKPTAKKPQRKDPPPEQAQPDRKEKRQFKLIHQIKKEKATKAKQKQADQEQSEIYQRAGIAHIEAVGAKKMDLFAEELHDILHSPPTSIQTPTEDVPPAKSKVAPQMNSILEPPVLTKEPSKLPPSIPSKQESPAITHEESYREPDLNRSCLKAEQILRHRRDSSFSMDIPERLSRMREEMNASLALQSINHTKSGVSSFLRELQEGSGGRMGTGERIKVHMGILQRLSQFVLESTRFDVVTEEWEELNFLIYKKYYIERLKALNFISKYPMRNPFSLYNAEIPSKEIIDFMKTEDGQRLRTQIVRENTEIRGRLGTFYSHFDKAKVGEKINLFQYDNFSHWIIEELWAELILTEYNTSHQRQVVEHRMCRILQLIFLISQLNGKYEFPFQEAQRAIRSKQYQEYIRQGKHIFQKYILYKKTN